MMRYRVLLAVIGLLTGCASGTPQATPTESAIVMPKTIHEMTYQVGRSVEGRPIEATVLGSGSRTLLCLATVHGNEPAGRPLLLRLREHLRANPALMDGWRVVLVPVVNPDGLAARTRHNSRGVDLNRNFPAENHGAETGGRPLSEPESRAVHHLIRKYQPMRILTLHQPLVCVDYDGPAETLARRMAEASGLPLKKLGGLPGSLGSWAGVDRNIPIVTLELPPQAHRLPDDTLWDQYHQALLIGLMW